MDQEASSSSRKLFLSTTESTATNIKDSMLALEALLEIKIKDPATKDGNKGVSAQDASQVLSTATVADNAANPWSSHQGRISSIGVANVVPNNANTQLDSLFVLPQAPRNLVAHKSNRSEVRPISSSHAEEPRQANPQVIAVSLNGFTSPPIAFVQPQNGNITAHGIHQPPLLANLYQPTFTRSTPVNEAAYTFVAANPRAVSRQVVMPPGLAQASFVSVLQQGQGFPQAHCPHGAGSLKASPAANAHQPSNGLKLAPTGIKSNANGRPNVYSALLGSLDVHSNSSTSSGSQSNGGLPPSPIRPSQVEAALRSKPQRGKKRDNLSLSERLELTRTRNREHAKSTRIRKKARFEELWHRELEWHKYYDKELVENARRQCLVDFMRFRSSAIKADSRFRSSDAIGPEKGNSSLRDGRHKDESGCKDGSDSSTDATVKISNRAGEPEEPPASKKIPDTVMGGGDAPRTGADWAESFEYGEEYKTPENDAPSLQAYQSANKETTTSWEMFVQDPASFLFSSHPSLAGCAPSGTEFAGVEGLVTVESALASCVGAQFRNEGREILALWIEVLDGADGVALVKDVALLQFQLVVIYEEALGQLDRAVSLTDSAADPSSKSCVAASGVLRVTFAPSSKKMSSLEICSCDTPFGQPLEARSRPGNSNGHNLTHSVSAWPSVVSLDQQHHDANFEGNKGKPPAAQS